MDFSGKRQKLEKSLNIAQDVAPSDLGDVNTEDTCRFFIEHKKRFCKSKFVKGSQYCADHSCSLQEENVRKRVPCPLNKNHSCYEDNLAKHLKKCNYRPELRPACYKEGINSGELQEDDKCQEKVSIRTVETEEIEELLARMKKIFNDHIKEVKKEILFHTVMQEEAEDPMNGPSAQKHIAQQASIIGLMEKHGLLTDHTCYTEFGAGKGGLSHWLQRAVHHHTDTQFVLIDKGSVRYKLDNFHKGIDQGPSFERIKIDIQNLDINCVPNFNNDRAMVCTGKHLCGAATDLMLRCTMAYKAKDKGEEGQQVEDKKVEEENEKTEGETGREDSHKSQGCKSFMKGIALALCCHHRCEWRSYVGKDFLKSCGLSSCRQFQLLCGITSWATCAAKHVQNKDKQSEEGSGSSSEAGTYKHFRYGDLLPQEREQLGNVAKYIIDWGRVVYLREHGYQADILQYVDKESTLENVCLIARSLSKEQRQEDDDCTGWS